MKTCFLSLLQEFHGQGLTDGAFGRHRFFHCMTNSAVFVPINKLRSCADPDQFQEAEDGDSGIDMHQV